LETLASVSSFKNDYEEFYRLALLLTGNVNSAARALEEITAEGASHIRQIRDKKRMAAWYVRRLREKADDLMAAGCGESSAEPPPEVVREVVSRVHALPEPDRSAVALFYLDRFTSREIAHLLQIRIEEFSAILERGRAVLDGAVESARPSLP
jgi:DNA-directed RNA polymerase specialized sigma24 family protein